MFEKDNAGRTLQVIGVAAAGLVGAVFIARMMAPGLTAEEKALQKATATLVEQSADFTKPVTIAVNDGMAEFVEKQQAREREIRARRATEREQNKPKAYRWKDSEGAWHLSDTAPPAGTAVDIIPLAQMK